VHTHFYLKTFAITFAILTTVFAPVYIDITADTSHSSTPAYALPSLSLLLAPYQKLSPNPQNQNRAFSTKNIN